MSEASRPSAEKFPGWPRDEDARDADLVGQRDGVHGPAPPKAIRVKSRGSWPRWIEISRMAEVMRATAILTMPSASASTPRPVMRAASAAPPRAPCGIER
jgi:hypothetical protein